MERYSAIKPKIFKTVEHNSFNTEDIAEIKQLSMHFEGCPLYGCAPRYLGVSASLEASYYIGADWLEESVSAIVVTPKMPDIDYIQMYLTALQVPSSAEYFSKYYDIDFGKPMIETKLLDNQLTPLMIIHFLSLMKNLINNGLKRGYVLKESNLSSKIRGKILVSKNIQENNIKNRDDRCFCRYQEYTSDIPENRLLKKTLLFAQKVINSYGSFKKHRSLSELNSVISRMLVHFNEVSNEIEIYQVNKVTANKLYKQYGEAFRLAKMILRRFDYSLHNVGEESHKVPAFWIDMSRLYEVYVFNLLQESYGDSILFQVPGYHDTAVDFVKTDEHLIIDTKYKPRYKDGNKGIVPDIREISGYARDKKILHQCELDETSNVPPCLIIYPVQQCIDEDFDIEEKNISVFNPTMSLLSQSTPIKAFNKFYKMCISLPALRK